MRTLEDLEAGLTQARATRDAVYAWTGPGGTTFNQDTRRYYDGLVRDWLSDIHDYHHNPTPAPTPCRTLTAEDYRTRIARKEAARDTLRTKITAFDAAHATTDPAVVNTPLRSRLPSDTALTRRLRWERQANNLDTSIALDTVRLNRLTQETPS